jgi:hypothetical protein
MWLALEVTNDKARRPSAFVSPQRTEIFPFVFDHYWTQFCWLRVAWRDSNNANSGSVDFEVQCMNNVSYNNNLVAIAFFEK